MNATDYLINAALVLLVLRQVRETRLTWQILLLPVLIVVGAAAYYLRSVPTAGNDLLLDVTLAAIGAVLGGLCALFTHLRRGADGTPGSTVALAIPAMPTRDCANRAAASVPSGRINVQTRPRVRPRAAAWR